MPFRRTIREVENPCGSRPSYIWEVLRHKLLLAIPNLFDLWNIGIIGQANNILRVEIIELSWTIPRLMRLEKAEDQKGTSS